MTGTQRYETDELTPMPTTTNGTGSLNSYLRNGTPLCEPTAKIFPTTEARIMDDKGPEIRNAQKITNTCVMEVD
jgi:hypothetical protein